MADSRDRSDTIFLHSLWRSGSTYFFNVFRRNRERYFAFQEPVHEIMLESAQKPEILLEMQPEATEWMRHPELDEAYFYEAYITRKSWKNHIKKHFIYDNYFSDKKDPLFVKYLNSLQKSSQKTVVIQECRTSNRIELIREGLGGRHFYLWREPWSQWWSYKISAYFMAATQLICNGDNVPASIAQWRQVHGFQGITPDENIRTELAYYEGRPLTANASYQSFFMLWVLAWVHAKKHADLMINMDALSADTTYRGQMLGGLSRFGVEGIHFDDCSMFRAPFLERDERFFAANEEAAWRFLELDKIDNDLIAEIRRVREGLALSSHDIRRPRADTLAISLKRAREVVERLENESSRIASDLTEKSREREEELERKLLQNAELDRRKYEDEIERLKLESDSALSKLAARFESDRQDLLSVQQDMGRERDKLTLHIEKLEQNYAESLQLERQKLDAALAQMEQQRLDAEAKAELLRREAEIRIEQLKLDTAAEAARVAQRHKADITANVQNLTNKFNTQRKKLLEAFQAEEAEWKAKESLLDQRAQSGETDLAQSRLQYLDLKARAAVIVHELAKAQNSLPQSLKPCLPYWESSMGGGRENYHEGQYRFGVHATQATGHEATVSTAEEYDQNQEWRSSLTLENLLTLPASEFVQMAYRILFGRAADDEGLDHFTTRLLAGGDRIAVLRDLSRSSEARRHLEHQDLMELDGQAFIYGIYQRFLHRSPDSVGLNHHLEVLGSTGDKHNLLLSISNSSEAEKACASERRLVSQIMRLVNRKRRLRQRVSEFFVPARGASELNMLVERMAVILSRLPTGGGQGITAAISDTSNAIDSTPVRPSRRRLRSPNEAVMVKRLMEQIRTDVSGDGDGLRSRNASSNTSSKLPYDKIAAEVRELLDKAS